MFMKFMNIRGTMEAKRLTKSKPRKRSLGVLSKGVPPGSHPDLVNFSVRLHTEGGNALRFTGIDPQFIAEPRHSPIVPVQVTDRLHGILDVPPVEGLLALTYVFPYGSGGRCALADTEDKLKRAVTAALSGKPRHEPLSHKVQGKHDNLVVLVLDNAFNRVREDPTPAQPTWDISAALLARVKELVSPAELVAARVLAEPQARIDQLLLAAAKALGQEDAPASASARVTAPSEDDPLRAARERGRQFALDEWAKPENLPLREAAAYASRSDRAINEARLKGRLYALVPPGKQRGLRYPQWQFDAEPDRLAEVLAPFVQNHASCWVVHNFMQRPLEAISDSRPMDWILDGSKPIALLAAAAMSRFAGDQGAA